MSMPSLFDPDPDMSDDHDAFGADDGDAYEDEPDDEPDDQIKHDDEDPDEADEDEDVEESDEDVEEPDDDGPEAEDPDEADEDEDVEESDEDVEEPDDDGPEAEDPDEDANIAADAVNVDNLIRQERLVRMSDLVLEYKFWVNPRRFTGLDKEALAALGADILSKSFPLPVGEEGEDAGIVAGIKTPVEVVRIQGPKGTTVQLVIDGQRRYLAIEGALGNGAKGSECVDIWIKVVDLEPEPIEWTEEIAKRYLAQVLSDVGQRQGLSSYEVAEAARSLRGTKDDTGKDLTIAAIAAKINRSPSWTSKIFTAMDNASPKLIERWRKGEIPEEMFRDLATGVSDKEQQDQAAEKLAEARKSGDKGAARTAAKEAAEIAKNAKNEEKEKRKREEEEAKAAAKAAKEAAREAKRAAKEAEQAKGKGGEGKGKDATVVRGPQAELPQVQPAAKPDKPNIVPDKEADKADKKPKPLQFAIVQDMVEQAKRKPPTHELVRGIMLGMQVATGMVMMENLPKPWHSYVHHLAGTKPDKKPGKKVRRK